MLLITIFIIEVGCNRAGYPVWTVDILPLLPNPPLFTILGHCTLLPHFGVLSFVCAATNTIDIPCLACHGSRTFRFSFTINIAFTAYRDARLINFWRLA
jgi:hypothetical protein